MGMSDRRSGPPLFDLMRERGERPPAPKPKDAPKQEAEKPSEVSVPSTSAQPAPVPQRQEARPTAWDTTGGVSRAERSAAAMLDEDTQQETGIHLSVARFYTIVAVALVLIVGAWAGGYQIGYGDGKDEMAQFLPDQPVVSPQGSQPNEPANQAASNNTSGQPSEQPARPQNNTRPSEQASSASSRTPSDIMTAEGFRGDDPRTAGMNYLALATLPTEQASDAIGFMRVNGVTVIGVPVLDSRGNSANNPSRYSLYSLGLAIPGNRWSAMSNQRLEHQQMIASLGARWQRERRGGSDFSQTNWEKYDP